MTPLTLQKRLNIIFGLVVAALGIPMGRLSGKLYALSHDDTAFVLVALIAFVYAGMRYQQLMRPRIDDAIGILTTTGFGIAVGIGASLSYSTLLGLALASTYYGGVLLIIGIRYIRGDRPRVPIEHAHADAPTIQERNKS